MAQQSFFRTSAESCLAVFAFLTLPWVPRSFVVSLSRAMGYLAFRFDCRGKRSALWNLAATCGELLPEEERDRIALDSFRTMALVALDLFWFSVNSQRRIRRYVRFDESADAFFGKSGPKIAVAAHFGNWEIIGVGCSLLYRPSSSVAAPLRNPFVDRLVRHMRQVTGQRLITQKGAIRSLLRLLREGNMIALLNDQNTLPVNGGIFVDFFGLPVPVSKAVAGLYVKVRPELAFVYAIADERGRYTVSAEPLPDRYTASESIQEVTQALAKMVENGIRRNPGKWAWAYKRWKFIPEKRTCEGFPAYARPIEPFEMKTGS